MVHDGLNYFRIHLFQWNYVCSHIQHVRHLPIEAMCGRSVQLPVAPSSMCIGTAPNSPVSLSLLRMPRIRLWSLSFFWGRIVGGGRVFAQTRDILADDVRPLGAPRPNWRDDNDHPSIGGRSCSCSGCLWDDYEVGRRLLSET